MADLPSDDALDPLRAHEVRPGVPAPKPKNEHAGRALRILVVDDFVDAADTLARYLVLHGHDVRTVHDGHTALATVPGFSPHVILLDIGLPRLDGLRVAEQIRQQSEVQKVCLIAITGFGRDEDKRAALGAGFDHFLLKPIEAERLLALLQQHAATGSSGG